MKNRQSHITQSNFARLPAMLVVLAVAALSFTYHINLHLHILPDGRVVAHSHPLTPDDRGRAKHQHLGNEYAVLNALAKLLLTDKPEFSWSLPYFVTNTSRIDLPDDIAISRLTVKSPNKRGPPESTPA